jgi:trehalose 6-phosphate synthase/phosphatase
VVPDLDEQGKLIESLKQDADGLLETDINGKLMAKTGEKPSEECAVYLRFGHFEREDRLALFRAGHVLLDTSVKAGLNLIPFEFIVAHHDDPEKQENRSLVIVSEFSGCSRVLLGSLRINPWSSAEVISACLRALSMATTERQERFEKNLSYTNEYSLATWFEDFTVDLRRARKKGVVRVMGFRELKPVVVRDNFKKLNISQVSRSFNESSRRVLLFDNEGTLAPDKRNLYREYGAPKGDVNQLSSSGAAPDEDVLQCLRELTEDPRNIVVILSGRTREQMDEWFGSVPKLGLCAERGFHYKLPSVTGTAWRCSSETHESTTSAWQSYSYQLMRQFVKRTQGAYIENKGSALVWQYRDADQHYGSWQAKELSSRKSSSSVSTLRWSRAKAMSK